MYFSVVKKPYWKKNIKKLTVMKACRKILQKIISFFRQLQKSELFHKISILFIGIASTVWFLARVIPKPSRIYYPCVRAAAPFMSSFIIYLITLGTSSVILKKGKRLLADSRYLLGISFIAAGLAIILFSPGVNTGISRAEVTENEDDFIPNIPYGEGKGIFPGRVVWAWNPDATDENCTNTMNDPVRGEDGYFLAKNNNQPVIDNMLHDAVLRLTGAYSVSEAWNKLFADFNQRNGNGLKNYATDEKVFVKINQGGGGWLTRSSDLSYLTDSWVEEYYGIAETSPQIVIGLLKQLVNEFGIAEDDIYVGDPLAHIYKHNYEQMSAVFPGVKYVDKSHSDLGRTLLTVSDDPVIFYSDKGSVMKDAISDKLYKEYEEADYVINVAALKAHARAGITLTAKNHFGTHTRDDATHLHPGLVAAENDIPDRTDYGMYRVLTDIMGHEQLGGKTVLFMVDGLWGGPEATEKPVKWDMAPFNGDWPNSLFISQDQVALESVCFDFLRNEFDDPDDIGKARPLMGGVDDYLHQAADSIFWPEGIVYDPENDGTPIGSLGVHEHWNNVADKQYSRNLGFDDGIELISTNPSLIKSTVMSKETPVIPLINGEPDDECWDDAIWHYIDQPWIEYGVKLDSADFFGRYKTCWSEDLNLIYFYVEVTDDAFIDGYQFPEDNYPNFDVLEVFIDEDNSGGLHVFDDNAEWGLNSENAFSYHLTVNAPADGSTTAGFHACDIDGTDWGNKITIDYGNHFKEFRMKKAGNIYQYEFSLALYNDSYDHASPESSRVSLVKNKLLGMSLAYCDNDEPDEVRDNFIGSVWVSEEDQNNHWINSGIFGTMRLVSDITVHNHACQIIGAIEDFMITDKEKELVIVADLSTIFYDPDGDSLEYTIQYDNPELNVTINGQALKVIASDTYLGETMIEITASDGQYHVSESFNIVLNTVPEENHACELTGTIEDFMVTEKEKELVIVADLSTIFYDPDGDSLVYTIQYNNQELNVTIDGQVLKVVTSDSYHGETMIEITASDGQYQVSESFNITLYVSEIRSSDMNNPEITFYPNPFSDCIYIQFRNDQYFGKLQCTIHSLSGKTLLVKEFVRDKFDFSVKLDLNNIETGNYIIKVSQDGHFIAGRMIAK
jgi:hypothetical protein